MENRAKNRYFLSLSYHRKISRIVEGNNNQNNNHNTGDTLSNVIVENWIFAPIAVTIQKMNVSKTNHVFNVAEKESKKQFLAEVRPSVHLRSINIRIAKWSKNEHFSHKMFSSGSTRAA